MYVLTIIRNVYCCLHSFALSCLLSCLFSFLTFNYLMTEILESCKGFKWYQYVPCYWKTCHIIWCQSSLVHKICQAPVCHNCEVDRLVLIHRKLWNVFWNVYYLYAVYNHFPAPASLIFDANKMLLGHWILTEMFFWVISHMIKMPMVTATLGMYAHIPVGTGVLVSTGSLTLVHHTCCVIKFHSIFFCLAAEHWIQIYWFLEVLLLFLVDWIFLSSNPPDANHAWQLVVVKQLRFPARCFPSARHRTATCIVRIHDINWEH